MTKKLCGFVLAAGEGRRMRPATLQCPKALLPFAGVPLLELAVEELHALPGMETIVVNACFMGDKVTAACNEIAARTGWSIRCSEEKTLLNHGGGIRKGITELAPDADEILVHNVDIVHDYDLRKLIEHHRKTNADATLLLIPNHRQNGVLIRSDNTIASFHHPQGSLTFSGLYIINRVILDYLPADEAAPSILTALTKAAEAGLTVQGMVGNPELFWSDVGTATEYIRAHGIIADCAMTSQPRLQAAQVEQARRRAAMEQHGVQCTGAIGLGSNLQIPAGTQLHNIVLWDNTAIEAPLLYADGIICGGTVTAPPTTLPPQLPVDNRLLAALDLTTDDFTLEPLLKQGSGRHYCRLHRKGDAPTLVWSAYNPRRRENAGFAAISDFLNRLGLKVPKVLLHLPDSAQLLAEDLGQNDLLLENPATQREALFQVLSQVARLHVLGAPAARMEELPLQHGFTKGLYDWERDYFRDNFLGYALKRPELWSGVAAEYCQLRNQLLQEPAVLIHRDLQSANVKVLNQQVYLIDFQGMRIGAATYDLASLLYDPYQEYSPDLRLEAWWEYCHQVRKLGGTPPTDAMFHAAAIQRLMQALGCYGKLGLRDGMEWYRQFIPPAVKHLHEATMATPLFPHFRQLAATMVELVAKQ